MNEERTRILDLLAAGKITAEEAGRLLDALASRPQAGDPTESTASTENPTATPKFMYVKVVSAKGENVNVKIPLSLVRAGLKLTNLIPSQAMDQINKSMSEHGMSIDLANIKPEELEELIDSLREMEITVDANNGDNVRVYCA